MLARIHSFESFGTVDGPGIRYVIFFQGCPLRCQFCHNPDTWERCGGKEYDVKTIVEQALKYKSYFANNGGITVTGGEPLFQIDFVIELFKEFKKYNINTACDTSGFTFNIKDIDCVNKHKELLKYTDLFLLDIKHIDDAEHKKLTGVSNFNTLQFAKFLSDNNAKMWIRHVLVPGINDFDQYLYRLNDFIKSLKTVDKIEILPYHTMGVVKYTNLGIDYPLKGVLPPTIERVINAKKILGVIKDDKREQL